MKRKKIPAGGHGNSADILAKCSVCRSIFDQSDLTTLEEQDQKTTIHVTCHKCGVSSIIFLSISQSGVAGLGVATDLNREEAIRMFGRDAVSADEVIDVYQIISRHKGNMTDMMKNN